MTKTISVRHVGKQYSIGGPQQRTNSLREALSEAARAPFRWAGRRRGAPPTFWALDDVSFDVEAGEVVGIIGRNGAGKSTLLKVLSRITEPTRGRIVLHGRVASLLEVGTGFHPELTGRENIYLNGTILGMRRREIDRKFDQIVDFAEVERFIETPVKRYSSGMYVRLAFAVAAHLEPEILVVDEVLAVGDAEFQRKCLGKISDVAGQGRTVLFVSHNMAALRGLCTRGLLLDRGRVVMDGAVEPAIRSYLAQATRTPPRRGEWVYSGPARPRLVAVSDVELLVDDAPSSVVQAGDRCTVRVHYDALLPEAIGTRLSVQVRFFAEGQRVADLWTNVFGGAGAEVAARGIVECVIPKWPFRRATMSADVVSWVGPEVQAHIVEAIAFTSHDGDYYGSGVVPHLESAFLFIDHEWQSHATPSTPSMPTSANPSTIVNATLRDH